MTDDCHKSKVAKKCPSSCNTCSDEGIGRLESDAV